MSKTAKFAHGGAYRVVVKNGGGTTLGTGDGAVTFSALSNQTFTQSTGDQTYDVSAQVSGTGFTFSYAINSIGGVTINASTGVITFATDIMVPQSDVSVTVTITDDLARTYQQSFTFSIVSSAATISGATDESDDDEIELLVLRHGTTVTGIPPGTPSAEKWQQTATSEYLSPSDISGTGAGFTVDIGTNCTDGYYGWYFYTIGGNDFVLGPYQIRHAPGSASQTALALEYTKDFGAETYDFSGDFTLTNLTGSYSIAQVPTGSSINSSTGVATFNTTTMVLQSGSGMVIQFTDQYGRTIQRSLTVSVVSATLAEYLGILTYSVGNDTSAATNTVTYTGGLYGSGVPTFGFSDTDGLGDGDGHIIIAPVIGLTTDADSGGDLDEGDVAGVTKAPAVIWGGDYAAPSISYAWRDQSGALGVSGPSYTGTAGEDTSVYVRATVGSGTADSNSISVGTGASIADIVNASSSTATMAETDDSAALWQETDGTGAVADGDRVGRIDRTAGSVNPLQTGVARPAFVSSLGLLRYNTTDPAWMQIALGTRSTSMYAAMVGVLGPTEGGFAILGGSSVYCGVASAGNTNTTLHSGAGAPTIKVNGAVVTGTRGDLHAAIATGSKVIIEVIGADLSAAGWATMRFANYASSSFLNAGAWGDFFILDTPTDTAQNIIRAYLADKHGITP